MTFINGTDCICIWTFCKILWLLFCLKHYKRMSCVHFMYFFCLFFYQCFESCFGFVLVFQVISIVKFLLDDGQFQNTNVTENVCECTWTAHTLSLASVSLDWHCLIYYLDYYTIPCETESQCCKSFLSHAD